MYTPYLSIMGLFNFYFIALFSIIPFVSYNLVRFIRHYFISRSIMSHLMHLKCFQREI